MKKMILASLVIGAGALCSCSANADEGHAVINLPAAYTQPTLKVSHALVSNMVTARSEADMKVAEQTVDVKAGRADRTGALQHRSFRRLAGRFLCSPRRNNHS